MLVKLWIWNSDRVENGIDACNGTRRSRWIAQVRCIVFDKRPKGPKVPPQAFFGASDHAERLAALREFRCQCLPNGSCGSQKCALNVCHNCFSFDDISERFLPCLCYQRSLSPEFWTNS